MTRANLVSQIAEAIARVEGFYNLRRTLAKRQGNPGNIRRWKNQRVYPTSNGFVDFVAWAGGDYERGVAEGWRVLRLLVDRYIGGHYTHGVSPSLRQMFHVYAPVSDNNHPDAYAETVAKAVGIDADTPLASLITN